MLVLRRKVGQSIILHGREVITVKVLRESQGIITIGVNAPRYIQVDREEIYLKKQKNDFMFKSISHSN
ncbi:MAG: carbon storage regulator [Gammaproteobacteria bacterium]